MNAQRTLRAVLLFAAAMIVTGLQFFAQAQDKQPAKQAKVIQFILDITSDPFYGSDFVFSTKLGEHGAYGIYRVGKERWTLYYAPVNNSPGHIQFSMMSPGQPRQDVSVRMNGEACYGKVVDGTPAKQMLFMPDEKPPVGLQYRQVWQRRADDAVAKAYRFTQQCQNRHCGLVQTK